MDQIKEGSFIIFGAGAIDITPAAVEITTATTEPDASKLTTIVRLKTKVPTTSVYHPGWSKVKRQ